MKPITPVSLKNCNGRLCGSVATVPSTRSFRCVSSNDPAPVPSAGCAFHAFQASCHQFQRLVEAIDPRCDGPLTAVGEAAGSLDLCHPLEGVIPARIRPTIPTPTAAAP